MGDKDARFLLFDCEERIEDFIMFRLHQHQSEALEAISKHKGSKGRVVIPTGGGKTLVEAYTLRDKINRDNKTRIHLVLAPRILLVNQLIKEYRGYIGQSYLAVAFHSGHYEPDYEKIRWAEESTTSPFKIQEEFDRATRMGKDLVVFSTYHSCEKLMRFQFDTIIADESQYCVSEGFFETTRDLFAETKLFFTATEKHTAFKTGRGLNNETVFGEIIYQVSPKTLIERKCIVEPRMHVMNASAKNKAKTIVDEVIQLASKQIEITLQKMPVCKILFAMKGTDDVKEIAQKYQKIKQEFPNFKVFTIVSNAKFGSMVDGQRIPRGDFFKVLRETDNALIFHYDILSEGIDVDGITGVAVLRNLKHAKLLQTIGRAVRIYKANPSLKTSALVSTTVINGDSESEAYLANIIAMIRDGGFEVNVENVLFTGIDGFGIGDDPSVQNAYGMGNKNKGVSLLENIIHELEREEKMISFKSMSLFDMMEAVL